MIYKLIGIITIGFIVISFFGNCKKIKFNKKCCEETYATSIDSSILALPNAFTPNDDGLNDILYVRGRNLSSISFTIKNNWKTVYESNDINQGWDGVYNDNKKQKIYKFSLEATTINGKMLSLDGSICLLFCSYNNTDFTKCQFDSQWIDSQFDPNVDSGESFILCN